MKIIDLLNKIANGEEVPKKIKYDNQVFEYRKDMLDYYCYDYDLNLMGYQKILNDEVEIIEEEPRDIEVCGSLFTKSEYDKLAHSEEEKKIPEKLEEYDIQGLEVSGYSMTQAEYLLEDGVRENREMINWILDYLKSKGE